MGSNWATLAIFSIAPLVPSFATVEQIEQVETTVHVSDTPVRAVLIALHGCGHGALDWSPRTTACPACVGLPEEMEIVRNCLSAGISVIAPSSENRLTKCWEEGDGPRIAGLVNAVIHARGWSNVPLHAFGASSGGFMATKLTEFLKLDGIVVQIATLGNLQHDDALSQLISNSVGTRFPRVTFLHMEHDERTTKRIHHQVHLLRKAGLQVSRSKLIDVKVHIVRCSRGLHSFTFIFQSNHQANAFMKKRSSLAGYLVPRIEGMTIERESKIIERLLDSGIIDHEKFFTKDPRGVDLQQVLGTSDVGSDTLEHDRSPLRELFNVCYAHHELFYDRAIISSVLSST